jgi:histidine phosphotransferase ChpT
MLSDETMLAEMLCTKLCHDLTGPIGAVNNGAEFLGEEGFNLQDEAMQLIFSSASEAVSRLQYYRQAYGRMGESGEASLSEKKSLADAFFKHGRIKLDWPEQSADACGVAVSQKTARLLLNLLLIASTSLVRGGTLHVLVHGTPEGKEICVNAEGLVVKLDADIQAILQRTGEVALTPKSAQAYLSACLLKAVRAELSITVTETTLQLRILQQHVV